MYKSDKTSELLIERVRHEYGDHPQGAHFHPYYEIGYLLSGNRQMTINNAFYTMEAGDMVLITKEAVHKGSMVAKEGEVMEWIGLYIPERYFEPIIDAIGNEMLSIAFKQGVIRIPKSRRDFIENILRNMRVEYNKVDDMSKILVGNYFLELMVYIIRFCQRGEINFVPKQNEIMADVVEYMYKNYYENLTLENMAHKYGFSLAHFSRRFKECTGCRFKEYLVSIRLKEACNLLLNTKKSITEIASLCGFESSNYFGDAFKKIKGVSPAIYRKSNNLY